MLAQRLPHWSDAAPIEQPADGRIFTPTVLRAPKSCTQTVVSDDTLVRRAARIITARLVVSAFEAGQGRGRVTVKVEPFPGPGEPAVMSPPWRRVMAWAMVRPIPLPPGPVWSAR